MTYATDPLASLAWPDHYWGVTMSVETMSTAVETAAEVGSAERMGRRSLAAIARGDWPQADQLARACLALADPLHEHEVVACGEVAAGIVAAVQGDATAARALLDRCGRSADAHVVTDLLDLVQLGRSVEAISSGRHDEALVRLGQLVRQSGLSTWVKVVAVGFWAEAALFGADDRTLGVLRSAVADLRATTGLRHPTAFARAVAGTELPADLRFDRAVAECPVDHVFDRARIDLARGMFLRRERRVLESRLPLQEALVSFERLGAAAWAERAGRELRATGERRIRREVGAAEALTAQELQIVRLAAAGFTNREIGQRLYLSHRTIGSHLYRAFPKLGIAARSQLRDVLDDLDAAPGPVAH